MVISLFCEILHLVSLRRGIGSPFFWTNQSLLKAKFGRAKKRTIQTVAKTDEKRKHTQKTPTPVSQIVIGFNSIVEHRGTGTGREPILVFVYPGKYRTGK
jgi:hypothetical protein